MKTAVSLSRTIPACVLVLIALSAPSSALGTSDGAGADSTASNPSGWRRPVDGAVVRPFEEPRSAYGPGHRGVDLAAAPGTAVRAANDGIVSFAGQVGGTVHVTVTHAGNLRTSYSFLSSVAVRVGQGVARGEVVGTTGGSGPDHDGHVLHFGLRIGDRYVDPMTLFSPSDLTRLVHLVKAQAPDETSWSVASERRALQASLALPSAGDSSAAAGGDESHDCGDGVPFIGAAVDAVCDVGGWLGDTAGDALDAGLGFVHDVTGIATATLDDLRGPLHETLSTLRKLSDEAASALARTPMGALVLDLVEIGRRFYDTVTAECSDDAPPADGTGGSGHRVMVVAGINSSGEAGDRGPTVDLDVASLGYHADDGEVRYFSYAADGGPYVPHDTQQKIEISAQLLLEQLRVMQREEPGREVDLVAHSQGGVVVAYFLEHLYHSVDRTLPPIGNVITLSSPLQGAPLATAGAEIRGSTLGKGALDGLEQMLPGLPPSGSDAVTELAEGSRFMRHLWDRGLPEHVDFTTIGAAEDLIVPANKISVAGASETVVAVNDLNEHHAIVNDPDALRVVRAALEHRAPPCVGLDTALRSAVAPVVISRLEHTFGSGTARVLDGAGR